MKTKNLPPSPSMGVDTKPAHRLEIDGYWVLIDPAMPQKILAKHFPNLLHVETPKKPQPIIEKEITHIKNVWYRNGRKVHSIRRGANGVFISNRWTESADGERYVCSSDNLLHDSETGKCWRDSDFDIMDFKNVKKFITINPPFSR